MHVAEKEAVERVVRDLFARITAFNYEAMRAQCAKGCLIIEHDMRMTIESLIAAMRESFEGKAVFTYTFDDFVTDVDGATAWTTYKNHGLLTAGDQRTVYEFAESAVLKKLDGSWRMVLIHSTRLKP